MFDGLCVLAIAPRNLFGNDAMFTASYTSHVVFKEDRNVPKWWKFPATRRLSCIVGWAAAAAFGTDALTVFSWQDFNDNALCLAFFFLEINFVEAEGLVIGDRIEYSF
jgi:Mn2+/Fe2+ NRAMP family transporter